VSLPEGVVAISREPQLDTGELSFAVRIHTWLGKRHSTNAAGFGGAGFVSLSEVADRPSGSPKTVDNDSLLDRR
jgi:hypothetical protein